MSMERVEIRRLTEAWPTILRLATDPWAKEFAASIWRQSGQPGWLPSHRQLRTMRVMFRQLPTDKDEKITLIE